jgi:hypothetical protein
MMSRSLARQLALRSKRGADDRMRVCSRIETAPNKSSLA